ncbi:hypothetical protein ROLI_037820 [Roseobacter fucihabitans]|uniref:Transposase n=1 Tax=Roseobacter fucihabitans TaxID=1537242 RepID=A0ABZ2BY74_9RHOB
MVSKEHKLSVRRQCKLLTLTRSHLYYEPKGESAENLRFMEIIHCPAGLSPIRKTSNTCSRERENACCL